ncbi:MAG: hypothetical protein IRZ10_00075 [Thermoflavifilum sp.]|nr:hypothetical protein [Thermoflavifilum sp.]MCL6512782.1 putative sporulation protein YtxC [Alicyclobacillus sp.]
MRIADLTSEFATDALERKLKGGGFPVQRADSSQIRIQAGWDEGQFAALQAILRLFLGTDWMFQYITRRVLQTAPYLGEREREYVALLALHAWRKGLEDEAESGAAAWLDPVLEAATPLLWREDRVHLDGLMRFRAREQLTRADEAVASMLEQFLADREYEEFVAMLRYMLDSQPESPQTLHVYCTDTKVWICDAAGNLVQDAEIRQAAEVASEGEAVDPEDLAMSILITRAPHVLVIHDTTTMAPWPSFVETLERVFLDRARRCPGCDNCRELRRMQAVQWLARTSNHASKQGPDGRRP